MFPKVLKGCPKSIKSPNLVTLVLSSILFTSCTIKKPEKTCSGAQFILFNEQRKLQALICNQIANQLLHCVPKPFIRCFKAPVAVALSILSYKLYQIANQLLHCVPKPFIPCFNAPVAVALFIIGYNSHQIANWLLHCVPKPFIKCFKVPAAVARLKS